MSCYAQASVAMTPTVTGAEIAGMLAFPLVAGVGAAAGAAMWCGEQLHRVYEAQQEAAKAKWAADDARRLAQSQRMSQSQALAMELALARWHKNNPSLRMPKAGDHTVNQAVAKIEAELAKSAQAAAGLQRELEAYQTRQATSAQGADEHNRDSLAEARIWQERGSPIVKEKLDLYERELEAAELYLQTDPNRARSDLAKLRQPGELLRDEAKNGYFRAWDQLIGQASVQRGQVVALGDVLTQAVATRVVGNAGQMAGELATLQSQLARAASTPMDAPGSLTALANALDSTRRRIERLQEKVFDTVYAGQQQSTASTIAATLGELGYVGDIASGTSVSSEQVGDELHVVGLRQEGDAQRRDEKRVAFFVKPDGTVAYDFSGYAGDTCTAAAREVFDALRKRGLVLLNQQAADELSQQKGSVSTDPRAYAAKQYEPPMPVNSPQVARLNKLLEVLRAMGFANQVVRQEVASGTMIVEAFNGDIGYRIVLPPHGADDLPYGTRSDHGQSTGIDAESADPVMQQLKQVEKQHEETEKKQRKSQPAGKKIWYKESARQRQSVSSTSAVASEGR